MAMGGSEPPKEGGSLWGWWSSAQNYVSETVTGWWGGTSTTTHPAEPTTGIASGLGLEQITALKERVVAHCEKADTLDTLKQEALGFIEELKTLTEHTDPLLWELTSCAKHLIQEGEYTAAKNLSYLYEDHSGVWQPLFEKLEELAAAADTEQKFTSKHRLAEHLNCDSRSFSKVKDVEELANELFKKFNKFESDLKSDEESYGWLNPGDYKSGHPVESYVKAIQAVIGEFRNQCLVEESAQGMEHLYTFSPFLKDILPARFDADVVRVYERDQPLSDQISSFAYRMGLESFVEGSDLPSDMEVREAVLNYAWDIMKEAVDEVMGEVSSDSEVFQKLTQLKEQLALEVHMEFATPTANLAQKISEELQSTTLNIAADTLKNWGDTMRERHSAMMLIRYMQVLDKVGSDALENVETGTWESEAEVRKEVLEGGKYSLNDLARKLERMRHSLQPVLAKWCEEHLKTD